MSISLPEEENFKITDNYYLVIKQIKEEFTKYIVNFKMISNEYLKKITSNNEKFNFQYLDKKYKENGFKDLNLKHILNLASIIPIVIEQQIINLEYFVNGIDEKVENFEKIFNEKSSQYLEQFNNYKDIKNDLSKKYREIERLKANYITNISAVEEMIHKFYMRKNNSKKRLNSISSPNENNKKENKKESNDISIEEQVNNNIQKVKKIEEDYKVNVGKIKSIEDKFIKTSKESKENIRKILSQLINGFKEYIFDCMLFLKNCYKLPLSEVDMYMNDLAQLDECVNFDKIIVSSYKPNKNLKNINPQKYTLKFFKKKKESAKNVEENTNDIEEEKNKTKVKRSNSTNTTNLMDEGFQEMDYLQEEEIFMTIKKMMENFELLNSNNYDLIVEGEKLRCKYLTLKILSFAPINKLYSDKIPPITDEEVNELEKMIDKKINRVIFIQKLSQFRTRGIFEIPEREYNVLSILFNKIVKIIENNIDYDSAINIIILSQTYYRIKEGEKEYLQKQIVNNELFKSPKFWEMYANYSVTKEISNCVIGEHDEDSVIEANYSNTVFAQLIPITDNMIDFGLDINIVESIILPFMKRYKFTPELKESITSIIEAKKIELQEKNKKEKDNINEENKNEIKDENKNE